MEHTSLFRRARTKIVATIGPACESADQIAGLIEEGADVLRLNMAHGRPEEQEPRIARIRAASKRLKQPVAVLADLAGPKIRLAELAGGQCQCAEGRTVRIVRGEKPGEGELATTYARLLDELKAGDSILLADGTVRLAVERATKEAATCRVVQGGVVRSRQGVNLPGVKLSTPALTALDRRHAKWAAAAGVDFLGLSFVRSARDVADLKKLLWKERAAARVVAKIEKPEALEQLESIVTAADGVMVARGDLGVEIDVAQVAVVQKRIIALCRRLRTPVIVATQMLESMIESLHPTRAEATDVANAVLDGADACMLSAETAVGKHPRQAVAMMHRIALATEASLPGGGELPESPKESGLHDITRAVVHGASRVVRELNAKLVVVASHSGATALALSSCRNLAPTVGVSDREETLRQMALYWGVMPLPGAPATDPQGLIRHVIAWGKAERLLSSGDRIVFLSGTQPGKALHNELVVVEV